ncbi:MAG: response regulator transcription factor [Planctomycetota bacterium]
MAIRILIADDHHLFRSGLRALFEKEADFEVVGETGTGPDTVLTVHEQPADVLLLDLNLPGLSGQRVAERVLSAHPKLAVVVLTMFRDAYYLKELLRTGVKGFMLKTASPGELLRAIRAAFKGETFVDPALSGELASSYAERPKPEEQQEKRLDILSPREREVCGLLAHGHTNAEMAKKLFISPRTVEMHRASLMNKLGLKGRAEVLRFAMDNNLMYYI